MKFARLFIGILIGILLVLWRATFRIRHDTDVRSDLRNAKQPYIVTVLHAHIISCVSICDEPMVGMVSRSSDGDFLVPALKIRGIEPVRGSTRKGNKDKGGSEALKKLTSCLLQHIPPVLVVDGPRGPRNFIQRGAATLALTHGCPVIPCVTIPSRRWILHRAWDRCQVPKPFSTLDVHWGEPIYPRDGEDIASFRTRIGASLREMERRFDPMEFANTPAPNYV